MFSLWNHLHRLHLISMDHTYCVELIDALQGCPAQVLMTHWLSAPLFNLSNNSKVYWVYWRRGNLQSVQDMVLSLWWDFYYLCNWMIHWVVQFCLLFSVFLHSWPWRVWAQPCWAVRLSLPPTEQDHKHTHTVSQLNCPAVMFCHAGVELSEASFRLLQEQGQINSVLWKLENSNGGPVATFLICRLCFCLP